MRGFAVLTVASLVGYSTASFAGLHHVARRFNEKASIFAREGEGKETVTVTVTSFPESCSPITAQPATSPEASKSASTPIVIVPGTQSTTATYNVPAGGATITPGGSLTAVSPMQPTNNATPSSAVSVSVPAPASANATSGAQVPVPVGSYGTLAPTGPIAPSAAPATATNVNGTTAATQSTTASESVTSTESRTTSTTQSTVSETSTTTPSATSSLVPGNGSTGNKSFNGLFVAVLTAFVSSVAFLI